MKKLLMVAVSAILFSLVAVGCSEESSPEENTTSKNSIETEDIKDSSEEGEEDKDNTSKELEEDATDESIKVYLPNEDATDVVEVDVDADGERRPEEIVIDELKADREDETDYTKAIRDDIEVKSVKVEGDVAVVDFSSENLNGGSTEEKFIINSVVKSLVALEGIERVQFLVDGEVRDTLMGHYEIEEPYALSDLDIRVNWE